MENLHNKTLTNGTNGDSTLKYVDVAEVHDGVIILKNGSLRSVLMMSSINFSLKSTEEQDAITMQYQNFLNSLDFPLQILISSRKLNINPYLEMLDDRERRTKNDALRNQISEYRSFIRNLTEISNIMSKFFYVTVPFSPIENKESGMFSRLSSLLHPAQTINVRREKFETYKNQLFQRVDHVTSGLSSTGVRSTVLNTEEILELLYNGYNPSLFTNTSLSDIDNMDTRKLQTNIHA